MGLGNPKMSTVTVYDWLHQRCSSVVDRSNTFFRIEVLLAKTLFWCPQTCFGLIFNFRGKKKYPLFGASKLQI